MIDLFRTSDPYVTVGRRLLHDDKRNNLDEEPLYYRDCWARAYTQEGEIYNIFELEFEPVDLKTITITSCPRWKPETIKKTKGLIVDHSAFRARDAMNRQEDVEIFKLINKAVPADHTISTAGTLHLEHLNLAVSLIQEHELHCTNIVMHPQRLKDLAIEPEHPSLALSCVQRNIKNDGLVNPKSVESGCFRGAMIYRSTMCPKNVVYVLGDPDTTGVITNTMTETCSPLYNDYKEQVGWNLKRQFKAEIVNDYACAKIVVGQ